MEIGDESLRVDLIKLIETVIIYKMPRLSREEIEAMLQVQDIRQFHIYQEGVQEGIEKERQRTILQLAANKTTVAKIAKILNVDIDLVRRVIAESREK